MPRRSLKMPIGTILYTMPIAGRQWLLWIKGRCSLANATAIRAAFATIDPATIDEYCRLWPTAPQGVLRDWLEDHGLSRRWVCFLRPEPLPLEHPIVFDDGPLDCGIVVV
jgi:hypothetical protein